MRGELVVGNILFAQHQLDACLGSFLIGKIIMERRTDQLVARAAGKQFHLLVDVRNDPERIGRHDRIDVRFDERTRVKLLVAQSLIQLLLLNFHLFAHSDIAQDSGEVTQVSQPHFAHRHLQREKPAILALPHDIEC